MNVFSFIFGVIALLVGGFVLLCIVVSIWNATKLEKENEKLREDLKKARTRRIKSEYKKVKEVK